MNQRQIFLQHIAQTSPAPIGLEIMRAKDCSLWDIDGKHYFDLISGFSVSNIGHGNAQVIKAIQEQTEKYMHLMVYGELIQSPQVQYAKLLTQHLPSSLDCVYFTNSGAEATEGAMKLAKRVTGKTNIIAFNKSYHGSTQGALSLMGDEYWRNAYRPLLPGVLHFDYGSYAAIDAIDAQTACVVVEVIQAESGVQKPSKEWLQALRQKCTDACCLLICDEIQSGFGRSGTLWAFEQFNIVPDVLLLGKALGGGMPMGAFIASHALMQTLTNNPVLGHINTFGGHPVCAAAGMAAFQFLMAENLVTEVQRKEKLILDQLQHKAIKAIRHAGLWMAVQFANAETAQKIVHRCVQNGAITDWFLFAPDCLRIAPPLIATDEALREMTQVVLQSIEEMVH